MPQEGHHVCFMELEFHHRVLPSDPARFCLSVPSLRWYTMFYPLFFLLVYMGLLSCALETVCISLPSALEEGKARDSSLMIVTLTPGSKSPRRSQSPLRPPVAASCLQVPRGRGTKWVVMETGSLCRAPSGTVFRSEAKRLREMLFACCYSVCSSPAGLTTLKLMPGMV